MSYLIQYACFSITGNVRSNHEDNLYIENHMLPMVNTGMEEVTEGILDTAGSPLIGVFDGMGGESCGEAAAFIAADTMRRMDSAPSGLRGSGSMTQGSDESSSGHEREDAEISAKRNQILTENSNYLNDLCQEMNREVCRYARQNQIRSTGSTAACILFSGQGVYFANVGDSRIYRADQAGMNPITTDQVLHSVFYAKPPLTQYLGMEEDEYTLLPQIGIIRMNPEDRYLLCTDGVTDMLTDSQIGKIIRSPESPKDCLEKLKQAILLAGARDNATAILCRIMPL